MTILDRFRLVVLAAGVLLSFLQALLSMLGLGFSGLPPSMIERMFFIVSGLLWIPALASRNHPRSGLLVFLSLLGVSVVLCISSGARPYSGFASWRECAGILQFALIGAGLLLLNFVLAARENSR